MSTSTVCLFLLFASGITSAASDGIYSGTQTLLRITRVPKVKECVYSTVDGMVQAMCANLLLDKIPSTLRKDIQILDFSGNGLHGTIKNDVLSSFTNLSHVYFTSNHFRNIEEKAFVHLKNLEVLDLSKNLLDDIPKKVFTLPVIKKLYLSKNDIKDSAMDSIPIVEASTLECFDISNNGLTKLPQLDILPNLKYLNISSNLISSFNTEDIAPFCSLEIIDISSNPIIFNNSCECLAIKKWIIIKRIKMLPSEFSCRDEKQSDEMPRCNEQALNVLISNTSFRIFEKCKNLLKIRKQIVEVRFTKILVVSCIVTFFFGLVIIFYCIYGHNKRKSVNIFKRCNVIKPIE